MDTGFWAKVWKSPIGRAAWALGRRLTRGPVTGSAITHRATELSLGMAAESLYHGLPRATRDALGDLPTLLHLELMNRGVFAAARGEYNVSTAMTADDITHAVDTFSAALHVLKPYVPEAYSALLTC